MLLTDLFALRSSRYDVSVFMQIQKLNTKIKPDVFVHLDLRECTVCIYKKDVPVLQDYK